MSAGLRTRWVVTAAVVLAVIIHWSVAAQSQNRPDTHVVRMRTLSPGDVLYVLLDGGGNSLALIRPEGVVLIDSKSPGWGRAILDAVEAVTDRPVTTIINTHAHADHVGGNVEFAAATEIVAHQNAKAAMEKLDEFRGANARFLPNRTVTDKLSLLDGPDRIDLYYFGAGHTSGDLVAVLPAKRVAYFGDLFPSKAAPAIDLANGGSGIAFAQTLARAVAEISGITRVVTGHGEGVVAQRSSSAVSVDISTPRTMSWSDLEEYADFNREFLASVQDSKRTGKSADEAASALHLPDRYAAYDMRLARAYVEAIYTELNAKP